MLNQATPIDVRDLVQLVVGVTSAIEPLPNVVGSAINGDAFGARLELAEACALRLAIRHPRLGHPDVRIVAVAGFGGTTRLPRSIGQGSAAEFLLTGKLIGAEEAQCLRRVNRVTKPETLLQETGEIVHEILAEAPVAVTMTWEAIHRGLNLTLD